MNNEEKNWAMFCHLGAFAVYVIPVVGGVLVPLILWLMKKDEYPLVDIEGKKSINFQISLLIYSVIAALLIIVFIGFFLLILLAVVQIVTVIIAAVKVSRDEPYNYPFSINFIN